MKIFKAFKMEGVLWFRLLGFGFRIKDTRRHPLLFSERVLKKGYKIRHYHIKILTPLKDKV